mgnify:CR=1 FL=1
MIGDGVAMRTIVSILAASGCLLGSPVAQSAGFLAPQTISSTALGARTVYATDLDGDGDADVLSASLNDGKIAWYENQGGGVFGPEQVIAATGYSPRSVYATDLDGDGDADVLSASVTADKIAYYVNDGSGSFSTEVIITTAADGAWCVFAADLDGDGDTDVLSASYADNKIAWYENQGGGVFGAPQVITTSADGASCVFATDLDGDGDVDVLSASMVDNKIAWYENEQSTATEYGVGCGSPAMAFTPTSTAVINESMTGSITNTPTPICVVAIGFSNSNMPGLGALPIDLSMVGMPGCQLWQSNEIFGVATQASGQAFTVDWIYPLPNNTALLTAHVYTQAFSLAPGVNALQVIGSNGIDWQIGS